MARVVGIVNLELKPGFTDDQAQELAADTVRDMKIVGVSDARLARADRGERNGKYVYFWEFESEATRDRYFPDPGGDWSDEWNQAIAGAPAALLDRYFAMFDMTFTDYVVLGE